jgi:hypothetical protein
MTAHRKTVPGWVGRALRRLEDARPPDAQRLGDHRVVRRALAPRLLGSRFVAFLHYTAYLAGRVEHTAQRLFERDLIGNFLDSPGVNREAELEHHYVAGLDLDGLGHVAYQRLQRAVVRAAQIVQHRRPAPLHLI